MEFVIERIRAAARRRRRRSKFQKAHSERSCNFVVPEPGLLGSRGARKRRAFFFCCQK